MNQEQIDALKRAKELLDSGILSQDEFNREKREILGFEKEQSIDLSEEQMAQIKMLEKLKESGIITEGEYEEKKKTLITPQPQKKKNGASSYSVNQTTSDTGAQKMPTKKKQTLWIVLGAIACVVVITLIVGGLEEGHLGNKQYKEIDKFIAGKSLEAYFGQNPSPLPKYERKGNIVYYYEEEDLPGKEFIGSSLQHPQTTIGKSLSAGFREEALSSCMKEDQELFRLLSLYSLSFCYVWNGKQLYVYSPQEIKSKLSYY